MKTNSPSRILAHAGTHPEPPSWPPPHSRAHENPSYFASSPVGTSPAGSHPSSTPIKPRNAPILLTDISVDSTILPFRGNCADAEFARTDSGLRRCLSALVADIGNPTSSRNQSSYPTRRCVSLGNFLSPQLYPELKGETTAWNSANYLTG